MFVFLAVFFGGQHLEGMDGWMDVFGWNEWTALPRPGVDDDDEQRTKERGLVFQRDREREKFKERRQHY